MLTGLAAKPWTKWFGKYARLQINPNRIFPSGTQGVNSQYGKFRKDFEKRWFHIGPDAKKENDNMTKYNTKQSDYKGISEAKGIVNRDVKPKNVLFLVWIFIQLNQWKKLI